MPAIPRPDGVDPGPRPRAAVGAARRGVALLGGPDCAQQPTARRSVARRRGSGGAVATTWSPTRGWCATCTAGASPHLPVRVRDGIGLVGPLVIPGVTSCLGCADLHRSDRDAAWPAIAAQLRDTVGVADRATLLATAALALSQVNRVIAAVRGQEAVAIPGRPGAERHPGVRPRRRRYRRASVDPDTRCARADAGVRGGVSPVVPVPGRSPRPMRTLWRVPPEPAAVKVRSSRFLSSVSMIALNRASAASCCVCFAAMAFSAYHPSDARVGASQDRGLHRDNLGLDAR